ncbi:TM1812 family CRISPR-associated protein [Hydrogenobaculum acidophilum]
MFFFSALKNNTPLVLYQFEYDEYNNIIDFVKDLINEIKIKLSKDWQNSANLSKSEYLKALLSLGFYAGIIEVLSKENIKNCPDGVDIDEIESKFAIYRYFDLTANVPMLRNEIYNLQKGKDEENNRLIDKASNNWEKIGNFLYGRDGQWNPRNFFAHAGFERTVTEIRKKDNKLYLRYNKDDDKVIKKIKNALLEYMEA